MSIGEPSGSLSGTRDHLKWKEKHAEKNIAEKNKKVSLLRLLEKIL